MKSEETPVRTASEEVIEAQINLSEWLGKRGLRLSEVKTRFCHITKGFDFVLQLLFSWLLLLLSPIFIGVILIG